MPIEKIGILHSAGYNENHPQDEDLPSTPNLMGRFRGAMAAYALKTGQIDRLIVIGGMPDRSGTPVEEGLVQYIKKIVENPYFAGLDKPGLSDKVVVLPRVHLTSETVMDTREARTTLGSHPLGENVTMISNGFHLFPRIQLISRLERFPEAQMLSAEKIYKYGWPDRDHLKVLDKITPPDFLFKQRIIEVALSTALIFDLLTKRQLLRNKIATQAKKRRVTQGRQY